MVLMGVVPGGAGFQFEQEPAGLPSFSEEAQVEESPAVADFTGVAQLPDSGDDSGLTAEGPAGEPPEAAEPAVVAQLPAWAFASAVAPESQHPASCVFSATVLIAVAGPTGERSGVPGFSAGSLTVTGDGFISVVMAGTP
jgi:hypothetical protein